MRSEGHEAMMQAAFSVAQGTARDVLRFGGVVLDSP
jgi:hypothetical protein